MYFRAVRVRTCEPQQEWRREYRQIIKVELKLFVFLLRVKKKWHQGSSGSSSI